MRQWISVFLSIVLMTIAPSIHADEFNASDYEQFIQETMSASHVPGLAVVLFNDTGIVFEKPFGVSDNKKTPVTLDAPFQLGSVSKSFAALLVVQLAAEGQVDLDGHVVDYLPDFRTRDADLWRDITVRHILSHRSGFATLDGNRIQDDDYRGADALEKTVKTFAKAKLKSEPGREFEYSNANYMLVAALVEAVTNQSFETVMDERIFKPLGMTHSYVQMPIRETPPESMGFRQWFSVPVAQRRIPGRAYMAAGGVTASARDLAIYVQAISSRDARIVPPEFADEIITAQGGPVEGSWGYGFGWMLNTVGDTNVVYHSGLNGGFAAHAAFFPDENRGAVVVTNQSGSLQADVPGAVVRKGLGMPTGTTRPSLGQHMLTWGMLLTVASMAFFSILSTVRFSAYAKSVDRVSVVRRVLPALALFALAYILVAVVPPSNGITLNGLKVFYPDTWLCLALSAVISVIWSFTRLIYPRPNRS